MLCVNSPYGIMMCVVPVYNLGKIGWWREVTTVGNRISRKPNCICAHANMRITIVVEVARSSGLFYDDRLDMN